ncbi:MAG: hypothetical protein JRF61_13610 [Deltaproteobacteria bacterium]|jgi:hypothetical protein|nr:hypothetical protein [Deltaproteobacteria bacterium]
MHPLRSITTLLAALALTSLIALGCNPGTEEPDAPAAPAGSTSSAGDPGGETSAGAPSEDRAPGELDPSRFPTDLPEGVEAAVPDNFPSDLPIYPGAQAAQGRGVEVEGVPMSAVQLVTGDAADAAYDFYSRQLESEGWTIDESKDLGRGATIQASKGDREVSILISPSADGGADIFVVTGG